MANAGTMSPLRIEEIVPSRSSIVDYQTQEDTGSIAYRSNYSPDHKETTTPTTDSRYRSPKDDEKMVDLKDDFCRVSADLSKIIQKIENFRLINNHEDVNRNDQRIDRCTRDGRFHNDNARVRTSSDELNSNYEDNEETLYNITREDEKEEAEDKDDSEDERDSVDIGRNSSEERSIFEENEDFEDTELIERGPIKPHLCSARDQPYSTMDWPPRSPNNKKDCVTLDYDTTAEQILRDKDYCETLNACLDQLEGSTDRNRSIPESVWNFNEKSKKENGFDGCSPQNDGTSLPSIVVDDPGEDSLLEILTRGGFQAAQVFPDTGINNLSSPAHKTWPDSPVSSYNVVVSRSESRASSRAQSPGSGMNLESPLMHTNLTCSPVGSPQIGTNYRVPQALSSSSSSNQSYADTPSPLSYQTPLSRRVEDRLGEDLESLPIWNDGYESSGTVVNSVEIAAPVATVDTIDSSELQLVEEVLRDLGADKYETEEAQVVPKSSDPAVDFEKKHGSPEGQTNVLSFEWPNSTYRVRPIRAPQKKEPSIEQELARLTNDKDSRVEQNNGIVGFTSDEPYAETSRNFGDFYDFEIANAVPYDYPAGMTQKSYESEKTEKRNDFSIFCTTEVNYTEGTLSFSSQSVPAMERHRKRSFEQYKNEGTFEDFQIPEMVASFETCRRRRNSDRSIMPWPSLNLPSVRASERLKEGLKPKDVERAMSCLLKRPIEELARSDEDGDTMLMCLVGNPEELTKKKAYLAPLVERLGNIRGALSVTNNRGEDALYLAAMNCARMSYVAGYLAAAMLQKGIDISQRLYHTRGDTLIHSVASRGDSHGEVLAELLALRTVQGNAVFDLSKRNYDGRTALHVAVESHDPSGRCVSSVATVKLLLENGADPRIKETKCGDTALHMAVALSCDPALVKVLLTKMPPEVVNSTNYNHNTALHMAAAIPGSVSFEKQKEVCWLLVHAGGQTNLQNRHGKTPLALVSADRKETIKRIFYKKT